MIIYIHAQEDVIFPDSVALHLIVTLYKQLHSILSKVFFANRHTIELLIPGISRSSS